MPIDSTLAHCRLAGLAGLFIQGVKVFPLEALLGVGWAGLRQLVLVGGWERFPAPSLRGCEGVADIQGLLEDRAGCGWMEKEEKRILNEALLVPAAPRAHRVGSGWGGREGCQYPFLPTSPHARFLKGSEEHSGIEKKLVRPGSPCHLTYAPRGTHGQGGAGRSQKISGNSVVLPGERIAGATVRGHQGRGT